MLCGCAASHRSAPVTSLRVGFVADLAQAPALVGVSENLFATALGSGTRLRTATFASEAPAAEALGAGTIDAAYLDPNSAYGLFAQPGRTKTVTVVAGAASGGASLVTRQGISRPADLAGATIAVPRTGSAADVALRTWLAAQGMGVGAPPGVTITTVDEAASEDALRAGSIDGAWLPEPWASRLVLAGGRILLDERALWPGGEFSSAVLAVRTSLLRDHPDVVKALLRGHVAAEDLLRSNPATAQHDIILEIGAVTGQDVTEAVAEGWARLRFTNDPLVATLQEAADHAKQPGILAKPDLRGFVDVGPLNAILRSGHEAPVSQ
jgi:NitT/TauT family transport system substrate-binding protein